MSDVRHPLSFSVAFGGYRFSTGLIGIITFGIVLSGLISLGRWQLGRAEEKTALLAEHAAREVSEPLASDELFRRDDLAFFPVSFQGEYLNDRTFLLDNRIRDGRVGVEVITPVRVPAGIVLVNRGWLARSGYRTHLPEIPELHGEHEIIGRLHPPSDKVFVLREDDYTNPVWPLVIEKIDIPKASSLFSEPLAPAVVRLDQTADGGFRRDWIIVATGPEKNHGYAFQWFALATAWCIIFLVVNTRRITPQDTP